MNHTLAPGPPGLKLVPNFYRDPIGMFGDAREAYGDIVCLRAFGYTLYQVTAPDYAAHVLAEKHGTHYTISESMDDDFFRGSLANAIGKRWRMRRRVMQPAFHHKAIAHTADIIQQEADAAITEWAGSPFDVVPPLVDIHHRILARFLLGHTLDDATRAHLMTLRHIITRRYQAIVTLPPAIPTPANLRYKRSARAFAKRIAAAVADPVPGSLIDVLSRIEDARTGYILSPRQMVREINSLFFNGYEDPGATVAWALYLLAEHPTVQADLADALAADQEALLNHVIDEVLRLYPPTWSILRDVVQHDVIAGYDIPQGALMQVTVYWLHRHPDYWPDPHTFDPRRFESPPLDSAYMPFGYGPRQCIGRALALMEIRMLLAAIVRRYHVTLAPGQTVTPAAASSLVPKGGLRVRLTAR